MKRSALFCSILLCSKATTLFAVQEYTKNYHSTTFETSCAIEALCDTITSYTYPQIRRSEIYYFVEFPPMQQICFQIYGSQNKFDFEIDLLDSDKNQLDKATIFCFDAAEHRELLYNHHHFLPLPFYLEEGNYELHVYGTLSQGENDERTIFIQRQMHFFQAVMTTTNSSDIISSTIKIVSPDQYGLLHRNEFNLKIAPLQNYLLDTASALSRDSIYPMGYDSLYFHVEGILNNLLPFPIDTLHVGGVEPASWFFSVTPMESNPAIQEILVNLEEFDDILTLNSTLFPQVKGLRYGKPSFHYIEFVLSKEEILEQRFFSNPFSRYCALQSADISNTRSVEQMLQMFLAEEKAQLMQRLEVLFTAKLQYYSHSYALYPRKVESDDKVSTKHSSVTLPAFISSLVRPSGSVDGHDQSTSHRPQNENPASSSRDRSQICIFSSNHMDGQKQIWLTQTKTLNPRKYNFHWIITLLHGLLLQHLPSPNNQVNTAVYQLLELQKLQSAGNIFLHDSPYNNHTISEANLFERVAADQPAIGEYWAYNKTKLYEYVHLRYEAAKGDIPRITPLWCREFYMILVNVIAPPENSEQGIGCDIMVYGNSRGAFTTDVFLVDVARYLSVPIVSELLNLFIDGNALPDVIIAPSTHAQFHESIVSPVQSLLMRTNNQVSVLSTIISPAIDTELMRFQSSVASETLRPTVPAKLCRTSNVSNNSYLKDSRIGYSQGLKQAHVQLWKHSPCVLIGFVARLAPEKNPGLFLQAASYIFQQYPFARFRFIGSGSLTNSLKKLASRMKLDHVVDFTGWIPSQDLPKYLLDLDIIVNPSLRGWSETFCITNIQSMYLGIPLVTFAVGGIGEYVHAPPSYTSPDQHYNKHLFEEDSKDSPDLEISHNAVILHSAHPKIVAEGVMRLLLNPGLARQLRERAQQSLYPYFTAARQIEQYDNLYSAILEAHNAAKKRVFGKTSALLKS